MISPAQEWLAAQRGLDEWCADCHRQLSRREINDPLNQWFVRSELSGIAYILLCDECIETRQERME